MYFLKKLYCEFVLGEIPNYFYILDSQGRDGGPSFERLGARHDPNVVREPVVHLQRENAIIPSVVKEHVEANALGTINALTQTLIHSTSPLVEGEPSVCRGHMCTSCGSLCTFVNHAKESMDDGLVIDEFLNDTFGIDTQVNYNYNLLI